MFRPDYNSVSQLGSAVFNRVTNTYTGPDCHYVDNSGAVSINGQAVPATFEVNVKHGFFRDTATVTVNAGGQTYTQSGRMHR